MLQTSIIDYRHPPNDLPFTFIVSTWFWGVPKTRRLLIVNDRQPTPELPAGG